MSKPILAFFAVSVLVYLAFAFIAWDLDPYQWHRVGRFLFIVFGGMFGGLVALEVKEMK